jgi:Transposase.
VHQATGGASKENEAFLKRVVTRYETRGHYLEPGSKRQRKHPSSPTTNFKAQSSAAKVMLTLFREPQGPITGQCQTTGETVNSERHCALLTDGLKSAIGTKRRGRLSQTVILQHENTRSQTDNKKIETIQDLKFELWNILLTVRTSRFAISTCSEPLKYAIRGVHLSKDQEVKNGRHS